MKSFATITLALVLGLAGDTRADFSPLVKDGTSTEAYTGLWFGTWQDSPDPLLPFETMLMATREAVTDGVAMKVVAREGSIGRITREHTLSGPVSLTFCVKASSDVTLRIFQPGQTGSQTFEASPQWRKIDLALGSLPWLMTFELSSPASEETWYIIDRLGVESPFENLDLSGATTGPEDNLNSSELIIGAEYVGGTLNQLSNKQSFNLVALGDSVTAGAQMAMGNGYGWGADQIERYKYSSVMARHLEQHFGYANGAISVTNFGHGGQTAQNAIDGNYIQDEVLTVAGSSDLVILEFGANDLYSGLSVDEWIADMATLIDQLQNTGVTQIVVMGITTADVTINKASEISAALAALSAAEQVAVVDITRFSTFRGEAYAWAYLSNTFHPDASGHMRIGHIASTLFTQVHFDVIHDDNAVPREDCTNGIDDDLDGQTDCADSDCQNGAEICDGLDNNCDGATDEGLTTQACPLQLGVCQGATSNCNGTAGWSVCDATTYGVDYQESEDRCDGLDNDCDGVIDEACGGPDREPSMTGGCQTTRPAVAWLLLMGLFLWRVRRRSRI